ncbi:hypothetical protein [Sphingobacterium hungaricum]|uniref:Uncharacterized protein n=1 Tax=Sphingobacterium hungaricum TaxID=2082723 RepID=A0A928USL8_9SPHI|nr:hypothetical protein [Sphingobacterium hungaricum]MBE8712073.1 hypothetical protein [Sphingobacterium hungaricum]
MKEIPKKLKSFLTALIVLNVVFLGTIIYILGFYEKDIAQFDRIDIKNKEGANRVVISNENHIPNPIIDGKEYQRRMTPAGIIFYDKRGDERGGIAISEADDMNFNAIAFDYQNADAIGMYAQDNLITNYFKAGITINDKDLSGKPGYNINRINLVTENGNASLVMKDANEVPRLVLKVDSLGTPSIEMYDKDGVPTWKP